MMTRAQEKQRTVVSNRSADGRFARFGQRQIADVCGSGCVKTKVFGVQSADDIAKYDDGMAVDFKGIGTDLG
jgi:hypothetical protein